MVALSLAEITSSLPTSGGLYFFSAQLCNEKWKPFASWMTGWFNLIGQFAVTAGIDFGIAMMLSALIAVGTDGEWTPTPGATVGIHIGVCFTHGVANSLGPKVMKYINAFSTVWQVIAPTVILITVLAKAPTHQSGTFVFTYFNNGTGWASQGWVILTGLLTSQFTMTGYDSSAHLAEETKSASISAPTGMVMAVLVSAVMGFFFIVGLLFCVQDLDNTIGSSTGFPVMQIIFDSVGNRAGAVVLMVILIIACWLCGFCSVTSNSRMVYAFSRDGAIPGSNVWHRIDPRSKTPINAVWLSVFIAALLGLPYLGNSTAFSAVTSVATIGLYISYGIPILCKLLNQKQFKRGPLHLGRFSPIVGSIALLWIAFITILFVLPPVNPVTPVSMNYACLAIGCVTIGAGGRFAVDARLWFKGPKSNLDVEDRPQEVATEQKMEVEDDDAVLEKVES
ncbi:amino acid/polyamine transporter I [Gongronella butleri]|nr:amino acid/polyamine transporter I [Gongronella butleri]